MRKKSFLLAMFAVGFAACFQSCRNDDSSPNVSEKVPATFSASISSTRASGTSWEASDEIGITTDNFVNQEFATEKGDGTFSGSSYYLTGNTTFSAYYPFQGEKGTSAGKITTDITSYYESNQKNIDYMFATASGTAAKPAVTFTFSHAMSMIKLNFVSGTGGTDVSSLSYTISNIKTGGTFDTTTGTATGATDGSLEMDNINATSSLIIWPQAATSAKLDVTIGGVVYSTTLSLPALAASTVYTYNVTVNQTGLQVSGATITGWTAGTSTDVSASASN